MDTIKKLFQEAAQTVYTQRGKTAFDKTNLINFMELLTPLSMVSVVDSLGVITCEYAEICATKKFVVCYKNELYIMDYRYLEIRDISKCTKITPTTYLTEYLNSIN